MIKRDVTSINSPYDLSSTVTIIRNGKKRVYHVRGESQMRLFSVACQNKVTYYTKIISGYSFTAIKNG